MNFSDYVKMLFPFIGKDMQKSDFVIFITEQIMGEDNTYHPLQEKEEDTLGKIFSGARELSKKDARVILENLDMDRFINFLSKLPKEIIDLIGNEMLENGIEWINISSNIISACTELFVQVLKKHAKGQRGLSDEGRLSLLERIERINEENIFRQTQKLFLLAEGDFRVAHQLRKLFKLEDRDISMNDFIFEDRMKLVTLNDPKKIDEPTYDIESFLHGILEVSSVTEMYNETMILFQLLNDYIKKTIHDRSSYSESEVSSLRHEIIDLLIFLYDLDDGFVIERTWEPNDNTGFLEEAD